VKPKTLSASSVQVWQACPARWKVEWFDRAPQPSSSAADLGTACHATLEWYVVSGCYNKHGKPEAQAAIQNRLAEEYRKLFADDTSRLGEATEMIQRWYERTNFHDRVVLSAEEKTTFELPTSAGPIPFTYIWDRCDQLDGPWNENSEFQIEVIDYKTLMRPLSADSLQDKIQARVYGLAAQLRYPDADKVWVTFDMLRYDAVGVVFTKEQNRATWKFLRRIAEEIIAADPDDCAENLNSECHWCVRKAVCGALRAHGAAGGTLALTDIVEAARQRAELAFARKGLDAAIDELDDYIIAEAERAGETEYDFAEATLKVSVGAKRTLDYERASKLLGPEILAKYGNLTMKAIDAILKSGDVSADQKAALRKMITLAYGDPKVNVIPKNPID
jgi:hypothetical protein